MSIPRRQQHSRASQPSLSHTYPRRRSGAPRRPRPSVPGRQWRPDACSQRSSRLPATGCESHYGTQRHCGPPRSATASIERIFINRRSLRIGIATRSANRLRPRVVPEWPAPGGRHGTSASTTNTGPMRGSTAGLPMMSTPRSTGRGKQPDPRWPMATADPPRSVLRSPRPPPNTRRGSQTRRPISIPIKRRASYNSR